MTNSVTPEKRAEEYLQSRHLYKLGLLPTESSHPQTRNLSQLVNSDLVQAIKLLRRIDVEALMKYQSYIPQLEPLAAEMKRTLADGKRIFICGCGATGRLALTIEYLWRQENPARKDQVVSFMAGGDGALVHSLEGFEDFPNYGAEHLQQLGFSDGDLLVSSTEGGETPYVIGATEAALQLSFRKPFFLYCNPREILIQNVERSKKILENPKIHSICLFVGPMALAGSTRMQASTVLQLAIGQALLYWQSTNQAISDLGHFRDHYQFLEIGKLPEFIKEEARLYKNNGRLIYTAEEMAITVFTDTTERSPTFSLPAFNNRQFPRPEHSLAYVSIPSAQSADESWQKLLGRSPRILNWLERNSKTGKDYLSGFDFGRTVPAYRKEVMPQFSHHLFQVELLKSELTWRLGDLNGRWSRFGKHPLFEHILLKMFLNIHSTLVMGAMGRFRSNFMTYVMPTNGKLVDRAARYVKWILESDGRSVPNDEKVVTELFRQLEKLGDQESVVLKTALALENAI